ncbi:hypothetical protein GIB67_038262 [Kingdonia uniflora]|uniref:N-acetylglucosaminylphosphatidylinositol deacetylase n=1 Tax=Kingdonia uniflora TaxID=39325 RepID=A0A7J7MSH0_9MAGN|nr:hypothetical protein GIB67_038262 [Kingdonia uniflora]
MNWLLIVSFLSLLWVVSLCKVLCSTLSSSKDAFISNGEDDQKRNILLVIAHPDDESMFFSPTILYLTSKGHILHILCLSTGNADGKGNVRKEELYHACSALKVPVRQVKVLDHKDLQDGFDQMWSSSLVAEIIEQETADLGIDMISTSLLRKYMGPLDVWISILFARSSPEVQTHCLLNEHPHESFIAMGQHRSQWVWFRKLFVIFSSYTYVNVLRKINY